MLFFKPNILANPWIISFWLIGVLLGSIISPSFNESQIYSIRIICLSWPLALFPFDHRLKITFRKLRSEKYFLVFLFLFLISGILSLFRSPEPMVSIGYIMATLLTFIIAFFLMSGCAEEDLRFGLILYGIITTVILTYYASIVGLDKVGRLAGPLNPNAIGMILVSVVFCLILIRKKFFMFAFIPLPIFILYITNSRASITGMIVGIIIYISLLLHQARRKKLLTIIWIIGIVILTTSLFEVDALRRAYLFIRSVYAIDDPWRGLGTGGTNRIAAWREAWDIFLKSPFVGNGYRMHEKYMSSYSSAHNGYLAVLADTGIVGFTYLLYLIYISIKTFWRDRNSEFSIWSLSLICSYMVVAIFERYFINTGNPTSLIVICLFILAMKNYKQVYMVSNQYQTFRKIHMSRN